jgi:hypothetical protein
MGRFAKNAVIKTGSYAIKMPMADTATVTPQYPSTGQIKFNIDKNKLEVYYNYHWHEISSSLNGRVNIVMDGFNGNGVTKDFVMTNQYAIEGDAAMILVFIGGLYQEPGSSYTVSGYNLQFDEAPPVGVKVLVLHNFNSIRALD